MWLETALRMSRYWICGYKPYPKISPCLKGQLGLVFSNVISEPANPVFVEILGFFIWIVWKFWFPPALLWCFHGWKFLFRVRNIYCSRQRLLVHLWKDYWNRLHKCVILVKQVSWRHILIHLFSYIPLLGLLFCDKINYVLQFNDFNTRVIILKWKSALGWCAAASLCQ